MGDVETVRRLSETWDQWSKERDFPFSRDHCINGTRVAIETLRRVGVEATPLSVSFVLFNRFAWDLFHKGIAADDWPHHAHSLGVSPAVTPTDLKGWYGHLVTEGDGWTLDVSARQFDRPGRITVDGPIFFPANVPTDGSLQMTDEHQQVMVISQWRENNYWRRTSGWKRLHGPQVDEVLRRMDRL